MSHKFENPGCKLRVFIPDPPAPDILNAFRLELLPEIEVDLGPHLPELAAYQVLVNGRPSKEQLHASHNLQSLVIPFAGVPASTRQLLIDFPHLKVYNLHHNAQATAELALALLFAAAKFILPFDQDLRRHDWSRRYQPSPADPAGRKNRPDPWVWSDRLSTSRKSLHGVGDAVSWLYAAHLSQPSCAGWRSSLPCLQRLLRGF